MEQFNIHHAQTHLSHLIEKAAQGQPFIIAEAGKPLVKVMPINSVPLAQPKRLGFMQDAFSIPEDFDTLGVHEINALFGESS